jgi:triacylglycerol lipase
MLLLAEKRLAVNANLVNERLNTSVNLFDLLIPVADELKTLTSRITGPISKLTQGDRALLFAELSILAYVDQTLAQHWASIIGFPTVKMVNYPGDQSATIFENENDTVISFRGTYNIKNFVEDAEYVLTKDGNIPGKVHCGFLADFEKLWPPIEKCLDERPDGIWATGHSLGGAMAAIAAVRASRRDGPNLKGLYTFGQPRIGNHEYVSDIDTPSYRWVNYRDLVPCLPPRWMEYQHFGQELYIDKSGYVIPVDKLGGRLRRYLSHFVGLLGYSLADHILFLYRDAIIKTNQESANGERR